MAGYSAFVEEKERGKADFVSRYRALCKALGYLVIRIEDDGYTAFAVARYDEATMDRCVQEMLLEPLRTIEPGS